MFKKSLLLLLYFFFALSVSVFAVTVDSSLYTGSSKELIKKYESLLQKLNKPQNLNYSTQKTILYTLINILKYPGSGKTFDFSTAIKNQSDYMSLFKKTAKMKLKYMEIGDRIKRINKKLKALENTIGSLDNSSGSAMTYQLQYAFYEITLKKLQYYKQTFETNILKWNKFLYEMFLRVQFDYKIPKNIIKKDMNRYEELDNDIEKLNIEKDRLALLNRTASLFNIEDKLKRTIKFRDAAAFDIIDNYILIYLYYLKHSKDLTKIENSIDEWINRLTLSENILLAKQENSLLYFITKEKIGTVKTLIKQIEGGGSQIAAVVWSFVKKPVFSVGNANISIFNIVLALFIFILGMYAGSSYKKHIKKAKFSKNITLSTKTILGNIGYYVIVLITFFISLKIIGINLSSLTVILGALSVGIGFGLQNMVSNFISGLILMLENSIRIGDYIEITDALKGVVKDIQMRSTTVLTNDNIEVIVPNQTLFQSNVINWTLTEKVRRFRIPFGVAYGTDVSKVQEVILSALKNSPLNYVKNIPSQAPEIKMTAMNSSSVDFNLDVWVKGEDVIYPRGTESKFLIMIYNALYENNISIPFPQLDVHVKEAVEINKNENKIN